MDCKAKISTYAINSSVGDLYGYRRISAKQANVLANSANKTNYQLRIAYQAIESYARSGAMWTQVHLTEEGIKILKSESFDIKTHHITSDGLTVCTISWEKCSNEEVKTGEA